MVVIRVKYLESSVRSMSSLRGRIKGLRLRDNVVYLCRASLNRFEVSPDTFVKTLAYRDRPTEIDITDDKVNSLTY